MPGLWDERGFGKHRCWQYRARENSWYHTPKYAAIKIYFEKIGSDFSNIERTHIYMQASKDLEDNAEIKNYTIIEGNNQEYKVSDEITAKSIVYNVEEPKRLPRTGY